MVKHTQTIRRQIADELFAFIVEAMQMLKDVKVVLRRDSSSC